MVDHLPNLGREQEMLEAMGLSSIDDLFSDIPPSIRRDGPLELPPPQTEEEIWADAQRLLGANVAMNSRPNFLGAGLYQNFVPTMVPMLATRGEFLTAYTPYQPEISQGRLEVLLGFQTMVADLTGMDIANASLLDEATAAAEAGSQPIPAPSTTALASMVSESDTCSTTPSVLWIARMAFR